MGDQPEDSWSKRVTCPDLSHEYIGLTMRRELLEQTEISKFSPSLKCIPFIAIAARLKNGNMQYLPFLVVEPAIQKKIFISANHPNHGWKHINVWNSQRVLWLLSILSLSVEFLSQVVLTPRFNLLNLEWWSWICNNGATEMEPIPSRFPISGGFKNRKKTHIFSKAR